MAWNTFTRRVVYRQCEFGEETILDISANDYTPEPELIRGPAFVKEDDGSFTAYFRAPAVEVAYLDPYDDPNISDQWFLEKHGSNDLKNLGMRGDLHNF